MDRYQYTQEDYLRFRQETRPMRGETAVQNIAAWGSKGQPIELPTTGCLSRLWMYFSVTVTTPNVAGAGNWVTYPQLPYALISKLRLFTSQNTDIINVSGMGAFLNMLKSNRLNLFNADLYSTSNSTNRAALYTTNAGPIALNTTYTFNFGIPLDVFLDDRSMLALIMLQQTGLKLYAEVTTANQADTNSWTQAETISCNVRVGWEVFTTGFDGQAYPNLDFIATTLETNMPFTNTSGDVIWKAPTGNTYIDVSGILETAGAAVANTNITSLGWKFSQLNSVENVSYFLHLLQNKDFYGITLPDGMFSFPFGKGAGDPSIQDPRDWLNTSELADLQFVWTLNGLASANNNVRIISRQLQKVA